MVSVQQFYRDVQWEPIVYFTLINWQSYEFLLIVSVKQVYIQNTPSFKSKKIINARKITLWSIQAKVPRYIIESRILFSKNAKQSNSIT